MHEEYIIHTRDALALVKHVAANPEFDGKWHTSPFEEFTESGQRCWSDFMSGRWAWKEAVRPLFHSCPVTHCLYLHYTSVQLTRELDQYMARGSGQ